LLLCKLAGIVSHAGVALIRALADNTGLTAGPSGALASDRLLVHDRGRVLADLACAIADGAGVINTSGSTVTLIGRVRTKAERNAVVGAAWMGYGVEVVLDELEVTG
jgi:hypothetical protein